MTAPAGYVLGQSDRAARRLALQDGLFAEPSEKMLDDLVIRPTDRVVELGCGPGGLSRRILRRLGPGGVLIGVDATPGLLSQATAALAGLGRFEPVVADAAALGPWLDGADVVVGRAVLHHVPMAELLVGRLRSKVRPGTRVGFLEPDFRTPLGKLALEEMSRPELAPLRVWASALNQLYCARRISPAVGATLAATMRDAGYIRVKDGWTEFPSDANAVENMALVYDEIRETIAELGILTAAEADEQQLLLRALPTDPPLPGVWGLHRVAAEA